MSCIKITMFIIHNYWARAVIIWHWQAWICSLWPGQGLHGGENQTAASASQTSMVFLPGIEATPNSSLLRSWHLAFQWRKMHKIQMWCTNFKSGQDLKSAFHLGCEISVKSLYCSENGPSNTCPGIPLRKLHWMTRILPASSHVTLMPNH